MAPQSEDIGTQEHAEVGTISDAPDALLDFQSFDEEQRELVAKFQVTGEPISKSRARFTKRGSKMMAYTPQKTLDGEHGMASAFLAVADKSDDDEATYAVHAHFYNGTRQRRDVDNMVKLILDGLNNVAWPDDNQVVEIAARKSFVKKAEARTEVEVYRVGVMARPSKPCIYCGTHFRTYESWEKNPNAKRWCSPECSYNHRFERKARTCEQCQKPFQAKREESTRFCSRECNYESKRATVDCSNCGKSFTKQRCWVRENNYCSEACQVVKRNARRSTRFPGTCLVCGAGTTRKEYKRCNPCKLKGSQPSGKPK